MLLYSGKFTGGYHESDLSHTSDFPFHVLFFRIFSRLHFNNNESKFFKKHFQFRVGRSLLLSCTWQEQALHKPACTVHPVLTRGELATLIFFPTELGPDNCQVNKHKLVRNQAYFHLICNSAFESWFKKVKC